MSRLLDCADCGAIYSADPDADPDEAYCPDCAARLDDDWDDDDEDNPEDEPVEQLLGPPGWGPAPMGSAKRDEPSGVQAERSEP